MLLFNQGEFIAPAHANETSRGKWDETKQKLATGAGQTPGPIQGWMTEPPTWEANSAAAPLPPTRDWGHTSSSN